MNILKLKKKPVIVEAVYFDGHNHADIKAFGGDKVNHIQASGSASDGTPGARELYEAIEVETMSGATITLMSGEYLMKGTQGEFYPCNPKALVDAHDLIEGQWPSASW